MSRLRTGSPAQPHWLGVALATLGFAALAALRFSPKTALYWYVFPLFGLGVNYVIQFRDELPAPWRFTLAITSILSIVALALQWPFSGHVLWNILFIGHARATGKARSAWMVLLVASLVYLFALKIAFQTPRDVVGAFIAIAVALVTLRVLDRLTR